MNLGRSPFISPVQPVLVIDGNVILVAKAGFLVLSGPAGLGVPLRLYKRIGRKMLVYDRPGFCGVGCGA